MTTKTILSPLDQDALERALVQLKTVNRDRYRQLDAMLDDGGDWDHIAGLAAGSVQSTLLGLKPWQRPPANHRLEVTRSPADEGGRELLRRLLDAGLSRYEPDPLAALAKAEKRKCFIKSNSAM